jgi:hypothetical protein
VAAGVCKQKMIEKAHDREGDGKYCRLRKDWQVAVDKWGQESREQDQPLWICQRKHECLEK